MPVGSYYINLVGNFERVDFFGGLGFERTKDFGIVEVLEHVPSYREHQELKEYMDYLIHNRTQLTNQITKHLDRIDLLEKKLEIATKRTIPCTRHKSPSFLFKNLWKNQQMKTKPFLIALWGQEQQRWPANI